MHPNRQFVAHFVVHIPSCPHDLLCVARPLHSNRRCEGTIIWLVPSGVRVNRHAQPLTMQGRNLNSNKRVGDTAMQRVLPVNKASPAAAGKHRYGSQESSSTPPPVPLHS